jgi:hypothetical protein
MVSNNPSLRTEHFIMMTSNLEYAQDIPFNVITTAYFQHLSQPSNFKEIVESIKNKTIRPYKFILMSRREAAHRFAALEVLFPIKDQGLIAMAKDIPSPNTVNREQFAKLYPSLSDNFYDNIYPQLPLVIQDDIDPRTNPVTDYSIEKFKNSTLHIVPETWHETTTRFDYMFFSEKTFKPIWHLQPFIIIGNVGSLKALRKLGYKTFNGLIDESYDSIENPEDRIIAIGNSVRAFCLKTPKEIAQVMYDMLPILEHNYKLVKFNMENTEIVLANKIYDLIKF